MLSWTVLNSATGEIQQVRFEPVTSQSQLKTLKPITKSCSTIMETDANRGLHVLNYYLINQTQNPTITLLLVTACKKEVHKIL